MSVHHHSRRFLQCRLRVETLEPRLLLSAQVQSPQIFAMLPVSLSPVGVYAKAPVTHLSTQNLYAATIDISDGVAGTVSGDGAFFVANEAGSTSSSAGHSNTVNPPPSLSNSSAGNFAGETGKSGEDIDSALPLPIAPVLQRIFSGEPSPNTNMSGLIDVTPRADDTVTLALLAASRTHSDTIAQASGLKGTSNVRSGPDSTVPVNQEIHAGLGGPPRPADQHLDSTQGRSQAFDLAARRPPPTTHPGNTASPLLAAGLLQLGDPGSSLPEGSTTASPIAALLPASASAAAVVANISGPAATPPPVRIDTDHRSRRTVPLVALAIAASELASRWVDPEKEGTSLYPPKPWGKGKDRGAQTS